jgi:NADPH:quinone reductase-like Zn-dependent oxidoreductase
MRVHATSVNPIDWKIRSGAMKGRIDVELAAILRPQHCHWCC